MRNFGLKVLSLSIAIALSFFVHSENNVSTITLIVPIDLKNLPPDKVLLAPTAPQAQITVRGPSYVVSRLYSSPPTFKIFLPENVESRFETVLQPETLKLPKSIEVVQIEPIQVEVVLDQRLVKKLQVEVPLVGTLENDLKLDGLEVLPTVVEVTGAQTELEHVSVIRTFPMDLRNIHESREEDLELNVPGRYTVTTQKISKVKVRIKVAENKSDRVFKSVPVTLNGKFADKFTLKPRTVRLTLRGPASLIKKVDEAGLQPYVDLPVNAEAEQKLPVKMTLPNGFELVEIKPNELQLSSEQK